MNDNPSFLLSSQQRKVWKHQKIVGQPLWSTLSVTVSGTLNSSLLKTALEQVLDRHEALCSVIEQVDTLKYPQQQISDRQLGWQEIEVTDNQTDSIESALIKLQQQPRVSALVVKFEQDHYQLFLSVPSIFADHTSLSNLFMQFVDHYEADSVSKEPGANGSGKHDDVQYVDYAQWQEAVIEEEPSGSEYWQDFGEKWQVTEPKELSTGVDMSRGRHAFSLAQGCYDEQQLLTYWALVLYRCEPHDQFIINSLFDGRLSDEFDTGIGAYSQTVPLPLTVSENMPVTALTQQIIQANQDGKTYQAFTPADLRVDNRYGFEFIKYPAARQAKGATFTVTEQQVPIHHEGVTLICTKIGSSQSMVIDYDANLFSAAEVSNLGDMLLTSLEQGKSDKAINVVNLLSEANRAVLYETVNQVEGYRGTECFHQMFEQQVQQCPDTTAIKFEGQTYSYQALNTDANQLANYLAEQQIGPDKVMAVYLPRSYQLVVCLLAVMKTGAAYCAIDPATSGERLKFILTGTTGVVCNTELSQNLPQQAVDYIQVYPQELKEQLAEFDDKNLNRKIDLSAIAYILYTSGSTGKPKGVLVKHLGLANYLQWASQNYLFSRSRLPNDTPSGCNSIVHTSIGFDLTVTSLYLPLLVGGEACLADDDNIDNLRQALVDNQKTTLLKLTPSHLKMLNSWFETNQFQQVRIDTLVLGGESLNCKDLETCFEFLPDLRVYNEYGPTEATVGCCVALITSKDRGNASIGLPIANTAMYVLDLDGCLLPPGVIGELFIGGDCLAKGYFGRDDLTEERFVANTANPTQGGLLYKTGDLVRLNNSAQLQFEFIGRNDRQVKVNGFRIELDEIERTINAHESVDSVLVTTELNHFNENTLVAFVVTHGDKDIEVVRAVLGNYLPDYMIPDRFIDVDQFPLTTNGKVDVKKLIADNANNYRQEEEYVAPNNEIETTLCKVFEDCLKVDKVGINDNFFSLGGDSIRGVQVVAQAQTLGIEFTMQDLFKSPTIATLVVEINNIVQLKQEEDDEMTAELLAELDGLSEEEVASLLAADDGEDA